nr:unnamed protein product [Callosobruchus analis]
MEVIRTAGIAKLVDAAEIYRRSKEALKKYYDNIKKTVRKEVADEKREMFKTGGGTVQYVSNPVKELALGLMNVKTVKGLSNEFDSDAVENIYDDEDKDLEEFEACEMPIDHTYSNGAPLGEQQQSTLSNVNHDLSSNKKNNSEPTGSKREREREQNQEKNISKKINTKDDPNILSEIKIATPSEC